MSLLRVEGLRVHYLGSAEALGGAEFELQEGESLAVIGESGAGKTTLARAVAGLLDPAVVGGSVRFRDKELVGASEEELRELRWRRIAYAPQGSPFNPVVSLGEQVSEPLRLHLGMGKKEAAERVEKLALEVGLDPELLERYPHQLSGGQLRLALLAMALGCDPELVILDEPTAGLDVSTAHRFLDRLRGAASERGFGLIIISHDLPAASRLCSQTLVLYAGQVAELGETERVILEPAHPYTWALVNAYPVMNTSKDLRPIRGIPPDPRALPAGCRFHPRCPQAEEICTRELPPLEEHRGRRITCLLGGIQPLLRAENLSKSYEVGGPFRRQHQPAVRGVSIDVLHGEVVGLIGPSGSGKSTLARMAAGLLAPDEGRALLAVGGLGRQKPGENRFGGEDLWEIPERRRREVRRHIQLVFQNPAEALSPRMRVLELVREPLDIAGEGSPAERRTRSVKALERVGLEPRPGLLDAYTYQLSGGQQQRVAIARALVSEPRLLLADEPTSMLDASEQARLIQLLKGLQVERGMGMLFVSHDIALVRKVADRIVVLEEGRMVEEGSSGSISSAPKSPLVRQLVEASPAFLGAEAMSVSEAKEE